MLHIALGNNIATGYKVNISYTLSCSYTNSEERDMFTHAPHMHRIPLREQAMMTAAAVREMTAT